MLYKNYQNIGIVLNYNCLQLAGLFLNISKLKPMKFSLGQTAAAVIGLLLTLKIQAKLFEAGNFQPNYITIFTLGFIVLTIVSVVKMETSEEEETDNGHYYEEGIMREIFA